MGTWIDCDIIKPPIGTWCNVLCDTHLGDYYTQHTFDGNSWVKKPRYSVYAAKLREIDDEGYTHWQRWEMSDGGPMGSLYTVSHWQMYPAAPTEIYYDE